MKRIVKYIAIDPYYSDQEQVYIGANAEEIDKIQWETEEFMAKEHYFLGAIYEKEIIFDNTDNF